MATAKGALRKLREICLALPDTDEKLSWGQPHFRAGGKIFTALSDKDGVCSIVVGLAPARARALLASDPRFTVYPRDKGAVVLDARGVTDWDEVRALVLESYELVARGTARKK